MRVLLILPAYNEEKSILSTAEQIRRAAFPVNLQTADDLQAADGLQVDYLVINDGGTVPETRDSLSVPDSKFRDRRRGPDGVSVRGTRKL